MVTLFYFAVLIGERLLKVTRFWLLLVEKISTNHIALEIHISDNISERQPCFSHYVLYDSDQMI